MRNDSLFYKKGSPCDYSLRSRLMWWEMNIKNKGGFIGKAKPGLITPLLAQLEIDFKILN